ncbi:MAG: ribosome assembly cofactor RimP [Bacteroidia bacterium]|nr:ribosome assembly cofactor RimP [Bacteroidia bacterium]
MVEKKDIEQLVLEHFKGTDFFLVDVEINKQDKITIYFDSMSHLIAIDDCVKLSKHIEANLNRDEYDYELEVSSAGIDEPFKVPAQYQKHSGKEVKLIDTSGKRTDGILKQVTADGVFLETTEKVREEGRKKKITVMQQIFFPFENIKQTKRIIKF